MVIGVLYTEIVAAERKALALLDAIEATGIVAPGRLESEVERDIFTIASQAGIP